MMKGATAQNLILIGIDGLSPDGIAKAHTPVMDSLAAAGTACMNVQAVLPTSSSPNWASMMMGAGPELHKVRSNSWLRGLPHGRLNCHGRTRKGRRVASWPTFYGVLRQHRPQAVIACFNDWQDYDRLIEPNVLDRQWQPSHRDEKEGRGHLLTMQHAMAFFAEKRPDLLMIHLDHVDHAGHMSGHGTPEYYRSVEVADSLIGVLMASVRAAGMADRVTVLVTADHGGLGHGHGGDTPQERTVPWILCGPTIRKGLSLPGPFPTYHTAHTVVRLFGAAPPDCWTGAAVTEAFE
jgi:predicted AlkP superfamily pyrophosphatase or phosphodiesterase